MSSPALILFHILPTRTESQLPLLCKDIDLSHNYIFSVNSSTGEIQQLNSQLLASTVERYGYEHELSEQSSIFVFLTFQFMNCDLKL